jgi:thiol-disulfide isomerase/thioredoxin
MRYEVSFQSINLGAPEFAETNGYINTAPIKLADLRGMVVLVDFWTCTCINWIRTIPYLVDWNEKYANSGVNQYFSLTVLYQETGLPCP